MTSNRPFGEVIESSLPSWIGRCWEWDYRPNFGSLISITQDDSILIGIVYQIETGSSDPSRQAFSYQKTERELRELQPQIFEFLQTTIICLPVGFIKKGQLYYQLPLQPPKIHAFISHISHEHAQQFFLHEQYLQVLFGLSLQMPNIDELLLAILQEINTLNLITPTKFQQFIETYSVLTNNDYRRLKLFLQRAQHTVPFLKDLYNVQFS